MNFTITLHDQTQTRVVHLFDPFTITIASFQNTSQY